MNYETKESEKNVGQKKLMRNNYTCKERMEKEIG